MREVRVVLGDRSYSIHIGAGLAANPELLRTALPAKRILLVSNSTVAPLYASPLMQQIHALGREVHLFELPDGEAYKDVAHIQGIYDALLRLEMDRHSCILALGGGVVGDMAGFAAATYQRGIAFVQMPTTLLAQVDSSVGGKTGVNHPLGKNMIGAFKQPAHVLIDSQFLQSLPDREFCSGLAEVIKYALIRDVAFLSWLESNMVRLLARDQEVLEEAIARSCRHKAEIVMNDELEQGERALLNLGHTFGHAIETFTGYSSWLHGEAIAVGMYLAACFSASMYGLSMETVERIRALFELARLPVNAPNQMSSEDFLRIMRHDKKVKNGSIRLILLPELGRAEVVAVDESVIKTQLDHLMVKYHA